MTYYSQVRFAELSGLSLITVWRHCKSGKIKTKVFEVENKGGKRIMMPLIPEPEIRKIAY